jgi:hypothetical protein
LLTIVSLLIAIPVLAKSEKPGDVPAPRWTDPVTYPGEPEPFIETAEDVTFNWTDVAEAEKYSVDVYGIVLVDGTINEGTPDEELVEGVEVEWSVSFGTSDWNPDNMGDPTMTIPLEDANAAVEAAIAAAIAEAGITLVTDVEDYAVYAKVKGLDPHAEGGKKRQDNPFSDPLVILAPPAP